MTVELLDLEDVSGIATALSGAEGLRRLLVDQVRRLLPDALAAARRLQQHWADCVRAVIAGRTAEVHALRPRLAAQLEARLQLLRQVARLVGNATHLEVEPIAGSEELVRAEADLQRLRTEVFQRWHSEQDLEELAVRHFPLSADRLRTMASKHTPPPSWYDEEPVY